MVISFGQVVETGFHRNGHKLGCVVETWYLGIEHCLPSDFVDAKLCGSVCFMWKCSSWVRRIHDAVCQQSRVTWETEFPEQCFDAGTQVCCEHNARQLARIAVWLKGKKARQCAACLGASGNGSGHGSAACSLRWERLISARMRWKQLRKTFLDDMWEEMRWDEKSWDEVRWGEMRWEELTWSEMRWSVECEVWRVQCEVWGKSSLGVALHRGRTQVMFLDNNIATASRRARTHGPGWCTAHASSMDETGLIVYP